MTRSAKGAARTAKEIRNSFAPHGVHPQRVLREFLKRIATIALLGAWTAMCAPAADEPLPKAEVTLDRYIEVTGGKAAYLKRRNEVATGTMEFPAQGLKGTLTRYAAAPGNEYSLIEIEGIGKIETGVSGGVAWEQTAILGPRVKSGEERAQALREATFNAALEWRKIYPKVETTGLEPVNGEQCYKVVLAPSEGNPETMYFSKNSGLLRRTTTVAVSQMGEVPVEIDVSDYKAFDGVSIPTKVVQKAAGQEFSISIDSVKANTGVPPNRFEPPDEVKVLLNKSKDSRAPK